MPFSLHVLLPNGIPLTLLAVIHLGDDAYEVTGMDFIIHNMRAGGKFRTMRKWFSDDADAMLGRVAKHVEQKLYSVISLQLSKHACVITCTTETDPEEWPEDALVG